MWWNLSDEHGHFLSNNERTTTFKDELVVQSQPLA